MRESRKDEEKRQKVKGKQECIKKSRKDKAMKRVKKLGSEECRR